MKTDDPEARALSGRRAQAAETRQRLISAAAELFAEQDFDKVQVSEISRRAGVAHGLLFHYFGSKRGLYLEVMRTTAQEMERAFVVGLDAPPHDVVRSALSAHLEYLEHHRGMALRLILGGRGADREAWQVFEDARWRALIATASFLDLDPGLLPLRMLGRATVAAIDEATAFWLTQGQPLSRDEMVDWILRYVAATIRAAADGPLDPAVATRLRTAADTVHP